jgi:hypothetical protein
MVKLDETGVMKWCDLDKVFDFSVVSGAMNTINGFLGDLAKTDSAATKTLKSIVEEMDGASTIFFGKFLQENRFYKGDLRGLWNNFSPGKEIDKNRVKQFAKACLKGKGKPTNKVKCFSFVLFTLLQFVI